MESKVSRALKQTSLISILLRSSPDSNLRGKKNKYSSGIIYSLQQPAMEYPLCTMLCAKHWGGTLGEADTALPSQAPRVLED